MSGRTVARYGSRFTSVVNGADKLKERTMSQRTPDAWIERTEEYPARYGETEESDWFECDTCHRNFEHLDGPDCPDCKNDNESH